MGLRINGTHIYLVSCLIALNLLCSNLQALDERDSVKNSFPRRQLALIPVSVPATSRSLSDLSPPAPIVKPNNEKKDGSNNNNKNNSLVPALVLSILGALLLACMILCCCKCKKNRNPKRDEHPLLHLNLNDFSGSSPNSHVSTPIDINKIGAISLKSESNSHLKGSKKFETPATPKVAPPPPPPPPPPKKTPPLPSAPPPPGKKPGPPPPPPPNQAGPSKGPARPGLKGSTDLDAAGEEREKEKKKLKPFFWDKVMMANPDQSMVWDHIKSGSFQFSEEMMESLFGVTSDKGKNEKKDSGGLKENTPQLIKLLDPKKSQNIAISLKAKNVKVEHVIEAVNEGNELPKELIETLIKMRPTQDEELKLKLFKGDNNLLGPAEQFYKTLIKIPFVFERLNALLFMSVFHEESSSIRRDFSTLEVACGELKSSRLFLKLLEAVLKLGNRMNDGTFRGGAQAFKLDTLLKLSDVKGTDGKTTLLHFVVQQIVQSEGLRASHKNPNYPNEELSDENYHFALGLKVVSSLGDELENVKKAAGLDIDLITNNVANLGKKLVEIRKFLERFKREINGGESGFRNVLECFVENATGEAEYLIEMERKIRGMVRSTVEYFHGTGGKEEGLRIFVIVRDFLVILERVCNEVKKTSVSKPVVRKRVANGSGSGSGSGIPDPRQYLFPAIRDRRVDSSSDEED